MLMAHPAVLRPLIQEYYALAALQDSAAGDADQQRMDDVRYTLCVATGTRDIDAALTAARTHLAAVPRQDDDPLAVGAALSPMRPEAV